MFECSLPVTDHACPGCGHVGLHRFFSMTGVPAHSVLLMQTADQARQYPTGDLDLGYCPRCELITNTAFNPALNDYSPSYEETQHFSETFCKFASRLVDHLVLSYDIREKLVIDIGCGKGAFLELLCQRGKNRGVGIDPSCEPNRLELSAQVRMIRDFYRPQHCPPDVDLICCRHTLEHIQPVQVFLHTVCDSLPRGHNPYFFFEVPDVEVILEHYRFWDLYYEHCTYFCRDSLRRLFAAASLGVLECRRDFDDQYLLLMARGGVTAAPIQQRPSIAPLVEKFAQHVWRSIDKWRELVTGHAREGSGPVIWGAGSKCVAFVAALGMDTEIPCVVDINPHKQGKFLPGSGHAVVGPQELRHVRPKTVLVMNPIYQDEVKSALRTIGVSADVVPVR